jgi:CheY-like chemotaxis protein
MGLASAYGIVKNHEGFIDLKSKIGKGARFDVYLPASQKVSKPEVEPKTDLLIGTETILLVDDESVILEVTEKMLEQLGYSVMTAKSGKKAIDTFKRNRTKVDLVLLDIIMPDLHGGEVFDRIKEINPDVKVLLSSGYSANGQAVPILERGCDGFIQKPFDLQRLSREIRLVLEKSR